MKTEIFPGPLKGKVVRIRRTTSVAVTETTYSPGLSIPRHSHDFPYFCAVFSGTFEDVSGTHRRKCVPSTIFLRPSGQVHADQFAPTGARCLTVELNPNLLERLDHQLLVKEPLETKAGPAFAAACRLAVELQIWDKFSSLAVEGLVLELLAEFNRSSIRSNGWPVWLRQATEMLQAHGAESLTLSDLAETVRIHPTHLARVFRAMHGCTVGEYVRRRRIQISCAALGRLDRPLSEIALDAGFADQSHFCRVFKRVIGESPAAYRRRIYGS